MKRKILSVIIAAIMILLMIPHNAIAQESTYTDSYGVVYGISDDGTYAIAIDGKNATGSVKIPSSVTINSKKYSVLEIGYGAFKNSGITELILKSTITKLGSESFSGCNSLESVQMYSAPLYIDDRAFAGCINLSELLNYDKVIYVGSGALEDTLWYENNISSPSSTTSAIYIGNVLYKYVGSAKSFTFKKALVSIAPSAFEGNSTLTTVTLGAGIKNIGDAAFRNCTALTTFKYNTALETIGDAAFDGCTMLCGELSVPAGVKYIGSHAFRNTAYTAADLSGVQIQSVPNGLFKGCTSLTQATFGNAVTNIGIASFAGAKLLEAVVIPSVTYIDYDAFRGCEALSDKSAFAKVQYIGTGAFDGTEIYALAEGKACVIGNVLYKTEESGISSFAVENGVKSVAPYALYNADSLETLALPASLESIDAQSIPFSNETDIILFSQNDSAYTSFSDVSAGKIIIPAGKTVSNDNAVVGTIDGLSLERYPAKIFYGANEQFDPEGMLLDLKASANGESISYDIEKIGYTPHYTYDFSSSNNLTVDYNGYSLTVDLSKGHYVKGAQIRAKTDNKPQGLRFIAEYADAYSANYNGCEFGFAVIPSDLVPEGETIEVGKTYIIGNKEYKVKTVRADNIFEKNDGHITYTVCITGTKAKNYDRMFTVVPYIKSAEDTYVYGESYETSIISVANAVINDENASASDKETAKTLLDEYASAQ